MGSSHVSHDLDAALGVVENMAYRAAVEEGDDDQHHKIVLGATKATLDGYKKAALLQKSKRWFWYELGLALQHLSNALWILARKATSYSRSVRLP